MCKISANHMKSKRNEGYVMVEVRDIDGKMFFKFAKSNALARMLCTDGSNTEKAMTGLELTQILTHMRDTEHRTITGSKKNKTLSSKSQAKWMVHEGTIISIRTPSIAGIDGRNVNVILDKPGTHVWVEADGGTLEYIAKVIAGERYRVQPNEPPKPKAKTESNIELPDSGMIELKSGPKAGYIRVNKRKVDEDVGNADMLSPEKLQKYRYVKIDYNNPDVAINAALRWQTGLADESTNADEDIIDEQE